MCAGVLEYECDGQVQDIGLYKNGAMAVLSGGDGQQYKGRLALLPSAALARQRLPEAALRAGPILTQVCMKGQPQSGIVSITVNWNAIDINLAMYSSSYLCVRLMKASCGARSLTHC